MIAQSITEQEIADKLRVDRTTISRDVTILKKMSQQFVYDLAHSDLAYYYKQCIDGVEEAKERHGLSSTAFTVTFIHYF
jgi:transcriptional antiterminator